MSEPTRCLDCGDVIQPWDYTGSPFHSGCSDEGLFDEADGSSDD